MFNSQFEPHSADLFDFVLKVNIVGTFNVCKIVAAKIAQSTAGQLSKDNKDNDEKGVIVNIASIAYEDGQQGQAAYAASKGTL